MGRPHSPVYTAEDIRKMNERKAAGKSPVPPKSAGAVLQSRVKDLQEEVDRLRRLEHERPTRATLVADLVAIFKKYGVEPVEELIRMATQEGLSPDQRIKVWTELAAYRHPKLKSVEVNGQVDMNFTIVVKKFGELGEGSGAGRGVVCEDKATDLRLVAPSIVVESEVKEVSLRPGRDNKEDAEE